MILSFFYSLYYHFLQFSDIELDDKDLEYYGITQTPHMKNITIYQIWRKYSIILLLPILIIDFVLNIVKYKLLDDHIQDFKNKQYFNHTNVLSLEGDAVSFNGVLYYFKKEKNILDYLKAYIIITSFLLAIEFISLLCSICRQNIWEYSKKYFKIPLYITLFVYYVIYMNPLVETFEIIGIYNKTKEEKLINDRDLLYSYSYYFVIFNMFKDMAPLILPFLLSLGWSARRLKALFFTDLYLGNIYIYTSFVYLLLTGGFLLFVVQFFNSYLITGSISFFLLSIYGPLFIYKNDYFYVYNNNVEVDQYNSSLSFISCFFIIVSTIFFLVYLFYIDNNLFNGIFKIYSIDISQIFIRLFYRTIYYRIFCSDFILEELLRLEKSRFLYRDVYREYNKNLRAIEDSIYAQKYMY